MLFSVIIPSTSCLSFSSWRVAYLYLYLLLYLWSVIYHAEISNNSPFDLLFRNEKYLASVAAGKWVLHKSYLEASREAGFFVAEESHEWGTEQEPTKLTLAVRRWRKKLSIERKVGY